VGLGEVQQVPGLPLGREAGRADLLGEVDGLPGVAEFDGDVDGVDGDVGRAELGPVVVAVLAELLGDLPGGVYVLVRLAALVVPRCGDGEHKVCRAVEREHFGSGLRGDLGSRASAMLVATWWAWSIWPSSRNTCAMRNMLAATANGALAASAVNPARSAAIHAASASPILTIMAAVAR
jgi:hypothetical protein